MTKLTPDESKHVSGELSRFIRDDCKTSEHKNLLGKILMEVREELK